jgi:hypothetical protein
MPGDGSYGACIDRAKCARMLELVTYTIHSPFTLTHSPHSIALRAMGAAADAEPLACVEMVLPTLMRPGSKVGAGGTRTRGGSFDSAVVAPPPANTLGEDAFSYDMSFPVAGAKKST